MNRPDSPAIVILSFALSFAIYFGAGYGIAWLCGAAMRWRVTAGFALPALLFLGCWAYDILSGGRSGIIYIPARALWAFPGLAILRWLIPR